MSVPHAGQIDKELVRERLEIPNGNQRLEDRALARSHRFTEASREEELSTLSLEEPTEPPEYMQSLLDSQSVDLLPHLSNDGSLNVAYMDSQT